jgi:hypothetical protein
MTNTLAYFAAATVRKKKKFYKIETWKTCSSAEPEISNRKRKHRPDTTMKMVTITVSAQSVPHRQAN